MKPKTMPVAIPPDGPVLLCVDVSYQSYRASAANPQLSHEGEFTGGIYGFLSSVSKAVLETQASRVVFCLDVPPYKRSEFYPKYKQLRKANRDDDLAERASITKAQVVKLLPLLGFNPIGQPGFESDDLIARAAITYRHRFARIWAMSNDSDLYQLFWIRNFALYKASIFDSMDGARLQSVHDLTPDQFMRATALSGTHNDVAGIPRVGQVTAIKAVKNPSYYRQVVDGHEHIVERNLKLIKLPHDELPRIVLPPKPPGFIDSRTLYRVLGRWGISATAPMVEAFERLTR